jgi:hypothetical protein
MPQFQFKFALIAAFGRDYVYAGMNGETILFTPNGNGGFATFENMAEAETVQDTLCRRKAWVNLAVVDADHPHVAWYVPYRELKEMVIRSPLSP